MMKDRIEQIKAIIKSTHEISDEEIDTCYNWALSDYVLYKYRSDNDRPSIEEIKIDFYIANWLHRRMEDIIERWGLYGLKSYKENGISFTFASSYIDPNLVSQIMPRGSVPR